MNLQGLPRSTMIALAEEWLGDKELESELRPHHLGSALWIELEEACGLITRQPIAPPEGADAADSRQVGILDDIHDRKARALHNLLDALADATDDDTTRARYVHLKELLFPKQLQVLGWSYTDEANAVVALDSRVTQADLDHLQAIRAGEQTLADVYRAWIDAGKELGNAARERGRTSTANAGDPVDWLQGKRAWVRAVRLLLDSLDMLSETTRERFVAPLQSALQSHEPTLTGAEDSAVSDAATTVNPQVTD